MKALNDPWVVGALAISAIAMVGYQLVQAKGARPRPLRPAVSTPVSGAAASVSGAPYRSGLITAEGTNMAVRLTNVDTSYFEARITSWAESPQRDPFHLLSGKPVLKVAAPSPVPTWKLNAIWQQAGKPLVVIHRKVYHEGEEIGRYKIARIDEAQVWFQGPEGLESLGFGKRAPGIAGTQSTQSTQH